MLVTSIYQIAKDLVSLAWGHKRVALEAGLIAMLLLLGWRHDSDRKKLEQDAAQAHGLAADLSQQITIKNNELQILKRNAAGETIYTQVYVPPEGYVTISEKEKLSMQKQLADLGAQLKDALASGNLGAVNDIRKKINDLGSATIVDVHDHGFTLKPGFGMDWANEGLKPRLDFKWYFWRRYGLIFGGSANGVGPGISRHLDDLLPGRPNNLEIFAGYNVITFNGYRPRTSVIGLRIGF